MANHENSYTGSQGTGTGNAFFDFTFPTYTTSEVRVEVDNVVKTLTTHYTVTNYNTTSGGKVRFTTGNIPTGTTPVRIFRQTDVDNPKATFTAGSALKAGEINDNFKQLRHALQEAVGANTTNRKIQPFNIEDGAITSDAIKDLTVARGDIANDAIDGTKIADDSVDSEHFVADSIDTEHYAPGSIDATAIGTDAVTRDKIFADAIDSTKLADNAVNSEHYVDGSIDHEHLAHDIIDGDNIQDDVINSEHYVADSIDTEHYAPGSVDNTALGPDAVNGAKLADNAVDSEHYVDGSIDHVHLSNDAVDGDNIANDSIDSEHYVDLSIDTQHIGNLQVTTGKIADDAVTNDKIADGTLDGRYFTETELLNGALDGRYFTETEADNRYFNISTGDTIKDGDTFPDNDTTIATTAAINDRIIDLVDDVGGFVPIANETSFPTANPDVNNGTGTLVSIKSIGSTRTPSGGTVTIANGSGSNTVTITGCGSTVLTAGFGVIVETTSTLHTYAFHRLVPKATEVTTVAGISGNVTTVATNIADINTVAADLNEGTSEIDTVATNIANVNTVGNAITNVNTTAGSIANVNTTAGSIGNVNTTAGSIANVNTVAGSIANVNTVGTNIGQVNSFANLYRIASSDPGTNNDEGDLYFNTTSNELRVYNGSTWQGGVTATGNLAGLGANTFTGNQSHGDNIKNTFGTGSDLEIYHTSSNASIIRHTANAGGALNNLYIDSGQNIILRSHTNGGSHETLANLVKNGAVELYYDNSKKLETTSTGTQINCSSDGDGLKLAGTTGRNDIVANSNRSGAANTILELDAHWNNTPVAFIAFGTGDDTTNKDDGRLRFFTKPSGGTITERLKIEPDGNVQIPRDEGRLQIGASQDLEIYHLNNYGFITHNNDILHLRSPVGIKLQNQAGTEMYINAVENAGVELYHNNVKKFETTTAGVKLPDGQKVEFGDDDDLEIFHYQTDDENIINSHKPLLFMSNGNTRIQSNTGEDMIKAVPDGAVELYHNNNKKFETSSTGASLTGNLVVSGTVDGVDIAARDTLFGGITANAGIIKNTVSLADGVTASTQSAGNNSTRVATTAYTDTAIANLVDSSPSALNTLNELAAAIGDDANFSTTITNSIATKLPLAGGNITGTVNFANDVMAQFGSGGSAGLLEIKAVASGGSSITEKGGGDLTIQSTGNGIIFQKAGTSEVLAKMKTDAEVELYHNGNQKLETSSTGVTVTGTVAATSYTGDGSNLTGINTDLVSDTSPQLGGNLDTNGYEIFLDDNHKIFLGDSNDFEIYHQSTGDKNLINSHKPFEIYAQGDLKYRKNTGELYFKGVHSTGATELYYNNTKKFETTTAGVKLPDGQKVEFGDDDDLEIFHYQTDDENIINSHKPLLFMSNGNTRIQSNTGEDMIKAVPDGAVELYHNNNKKFETTSTGVTVTGTVAATAYTGDGSALSGVASAVADGCIYENSQTISNNYTITTNKNALSAGPITIANGAALTIPNGSVYTIV